MIEKTNYLLFVMFLCKLLKRFQFSFHQTTEFQMFVFRKLIMFKVTLCEFSEIDLLIFQNYETATNFENNK